MADSLLKIEHLRCYFGENKAVDDVSLTLHKREVLGLVGESGSGKSTLGRCVIGLQPLTGGQILLHDQCIRVAGKQSIAMRRARRGGDSLHMQMIFQDPLASLDPRMTVRESIAEGLIIQGVRNRALLQRKVEEMLSLVGLPAAYADRYPHEFSGGQRQRIGIARSLVLEPQILIADEPVSALDVSVQAQVINLLQDLRQRLGLSVLFIAHDLSIVKYFCDRIAVMRLGKLVELAPADELFRHPLHPYTQSLLSAMPAPDPRVQKTRRRIPYTPPPPADRSFLELRPGHWVLCSEEEGKRW